MDRCPICGHELVSDSCLQAACQQIEALVESVEARKELAASV